MPNYTYACNVCQKEKDVFHKMGEKPAIKCDCGGTCRWVVGNTRFRFALKGGGWPDKERKIDAELAEAEYLQSQPVGLSEMKEIKDMAAEEEKKKGLAPGSIMGRKQPIYSAKTEAGQRVISAEGKKQLKERAVAQSRKRI